MLKYGKLFLFVIFILLSFTNTIEARRYYNPRLGIWLTTDPLSDKFPGLSPYNYALNNPLRFIDPDGRNPILFLQRLAQAAQRFGNTRTWQAARTYGDKAVNYLRRDWVGFTQKVRNLPSRVRNDAARVFNNAKNLFTSNQTTSSNISNNKLSESVNYVIKNQTKMHHIFGKSDHNLGDLVKATGGKNQAIKAVLDAAQGKLPESGIFKDVVVKVNDISVNIRGFVTKEGIVKLGTMFVEKNN